MPLKRRLVWQDLIECPIESAVIDLALGNVQQVVEGGGRIPAFFDRQLAAGRAEPIDREHRGDPRPRHVRGLVIAVRLEEVIQLQLAPARQAQQARAQLPRPFQPHALDQYLRHLRIVRGRRDVRGKPFQLVALTGLVEDLDRLQPPRLRRAIQLAEMTHRPLTRTIRRADRFHQRPVRVALAILVAMMGAQEHGARWSHARSPATRGSVCTTS
jgi:hypothetical protein